MTEAMAWCDGGASPNPGNGVYGYVIEFADEKRKAVTGRGQLGRLMSANEAEYEAAIKCVERLIFLKVDRATIHSDSQLFVSQVNLHWKCKTKKLAGLRDHFNELRAELKSCAVVKIPRWMNDRADKLCKLAHKDRSKP